MGGSGKPSRAKDTGVLTDESEFVRNWKEEEKSKQGKRIIELSRALVPNFLHCASLSLQRRVKECWACTSNLGLFVN